MESRVYSYGTTCNGLTYFIDFSNEGDLLIERVNAAGDLISVKWENFPECIYQITHTVFRSN